MRQAHKRTRTDLHSTVQFGTVGAPAKHTRTHAHVHSLFLLWSQREHTDLISPSQLASLGTNNPLRPFPPTEPIRAVTHCVALSLSFCALHLFDCVCMLKCKISCKVYSYILQGSSIITTAFKLLCVYLETALNKSNLIKQGTLNISSTEAFLKSF